MANTDLQKFNQTIQNPRFQEYLDSVLRENKNSFVTSLVSLVGNNTLLQKCEPMTVTYAALKAAALNLPFDGALGFAYCIPYGRDAQFQIGARGLARLAINTGQFKHLNVTEIYEGQYKGKDIRTGRIKLDEEIEIKDDAKVVGYLGYFQLNNGFEHEIYWSKDKMTEHAKRFSKTFRSGPWQTDFDAMAKKTLLKQLLKQGNAPMSIEMQNAIKADQAVIRHDENYNEVLEYNDNPKNEPTRDNFEEAEIIEDGNNNE